MEQIRLGIIGCGAITKQQYFPILKKSSLFKINALADKNIAGARSLGEGRDIAKITDDYREMIGHVNAAVIAVPNHLHASISKEMLSNGIHVLVEKPMAMTAADCDEMIELARQNNCILTVGLSKRFFHAHQFVKRAIDEGLLGDIKSFDFRDGTIFSWPAASDFLYRKEVGGVLASTGPHTLDLLLWWLGDYKRVEYYDDAMGGVEANCELHITMKNGCSGIVEISRTRALRQTYQITGEKATIEVGANWANPPVILKFNGDEAQLEGAMAMPRNPQKEYIEIMRQQLEEFAAAITEKRKPLVDGHEGRRSIEFIETCYRNRKFLDLPWLGPHVKEIGHA